jgi:hypothetical protein
MGQEQAQVETPLPVLPCRQEEVVMVPAVDEEEMEMEEEMAEEEV